MKINYLIGDALNPKESGPKLIIHVCNIQKAWGSGFVMAINKKWDKPEKSYHEWHKLYSCLFKLGQVQFVPVEDDVMVVNMLAQDGLRRKFNDPPTAKLDALEQCFEQIINANVFNGKYSIHCPRICCGLGGEKWENIEPLLINHFIGKNIPVFVYDLPSIK